LRGATIINGFPTVGLVSTITANYLIGALKLDQIGALDSDAFPPVSMIYASKPKFPARIYADEESKVVVFLSEFTSMPDLVRPIAWTFFSWAKEHECRRIVAPEVFFVKKEIGQDLGVYGVGNTDRAREEIKKLRIKQLVTGMVTGISGVLLNEGRRINFDVISLIATVRPDMSEARAAAKVIEVIDELIPTIKIDVEPLYEEAEKIEGYIKRLREQAKSATKPTTITDMYR
jgi:uncharacterized protein